MTTSLDFDNNIILSVKKNKIFVTTVFKTRFNLTAFFAIDQKLSFRV